MFDSLTALGNYFPISFIKVFRTWNYISRNFLVYFCALFHINSKKHFISLDSNTTPIEKKMLFTQVNLWSNARVSKVIARSLCKSVNACTSYHSVRTVKLMLLWFYNLALLTRARIYEINNHSLLTHFNHKHSCQRVFVYLNKAIENDFSASVEKSKQTKWINGDREMRCTHDAITKWLNLFLFCLQKISTNSKYATRNRPFNILLFSFIYFLNKKPDKHNLMWIKFFVRNECLELYIFSVNRNVINWGKLLNIIKMNRK